MNSGQSDQMKALALANPNQNAIKVLMGDSYVSYQPEALRATFDNHSINSDDNEIQTAPPESAF
jgi:hypothetical protein